MHDHTKGTIVLKASSNASSDHSQASALTVYYDGSCALCSAEIEYYASRSGGHRMDYVDVSDPKSDPGPGLARSDAMRRFHVRQRDGYIASGVDAFTLVWKELPTWKRTASIASLPGPKAALRIAYRLFLPIRPLVSCLFGRFFSDTGKKTFQRNKPF